MKTSNVYLRGTVYGPIWMPAVECWKPVTVSAQYADGSRLTLRDMALRATADGDFQSASLTTDSEVVFEQTIKKGNRTLRRVKWYPVSHFPSIADCVGEKFSWEIES